MLNVRRYFKFIAVGWLLMTVFCIGCGGGSSSGKNDPLPPPPPLSAQFLMDGLVDLSIMDRVHAMTVDFYDIDHTGPVVKTSHLQWAMVNDNRYLYVALTWTDDTHDHQFDAAAGPLDFDGVQLLFDNDGSGLHDVGEDQRTVIAASVASQFVDEHVVTSGNATDQIGNGSARLSYDAIGQRYQAEFMVPLGEDAAGEDGMLNGASRYSIVLFDHVRLGSPATGHAATTSGSGPVTDTWDVIDYQAAEAHDYPQLPSDLTGMIVFLSGHEEPNREVYSFNPGTGEVQRITQAPGLYKDGVSLSHDRRTVSFFAAPAQDDYTNYEIYTADLSAPVLPTSLTRLTFNTILDGHPAWSPDDGHIAYASFRDGWQASIIVMTADGTEVSDLTPSGVDDNDPEYLPDGRIIFKTDRFSTFPQVRIAVMDGDGNNVAQVTSVAGVSDHDPVGDNEWCVFERFNKDTDYATDPETGFTAWDIIESNLDGSQEHILMGDGWVNWLPVFSPDGRHILYLKSQPHTSAHLMTRDGEEIGRLIPGITSIGYIDWK